MGMCPQVRSVMTWSLGGFGWLGVPRVLGRSLTFLLWSQFDILWDNPSVKEHLILSGTL